MCYFISQGCCNNGSLDKERHYHNQHLMNVFIPLIINFFNCLHQMDDFFHWCDNMVWLAEGSGNFPLVILHIFYSQRVSIALQKSVGWLYFETWYHCKWRFFQVYYLRFQNCHPSFYDLLLAIGRGSRTWFVLLPLFVHLWDLLFWFKLKSFLSFLSFPLLLGVSFLMEFVRFLSFWNLYMVWNNFQPMHRTKTLMHISCLRGLKAIMLIITCISKELMEITLCS